MVITGPRQVGKTSLVQAIRNQVDRSSLYLDLEREEDLRRIDNLEAFAEDNLDALIILDEIQRQPELFPRLRSIIDRHRTPGRFLLLGSASLELIRDASESLAGRIALTELTGLTVGELQRANEWSYRQHWVRGGFPDSYLAPSDEASVRWRVNFIRTYLERDLPQLGLRMSAVELRRTATMLTHLNGNLLNLNNLSRDLGLTRPRMNSVLDYFEQTFLLRRLPPYFANLGKRLVKTPKVYFRDTGLMHALVGINDYNDLLGRPNLGASWEAYVIEQLLADMPFGYEAFFYRTQAGAEIDLLVTRAGLPHVAVEIKSGVTTKPSKGFFTAMDDLGVPRGIVVAPLEGPAYSVTDTVRAMSLREVRLFE